MYSRCGSLEDAQKTFDEGCLKNVVLWTAMIASYVDCGHGNQALQMYGQMFQEGFLPNKVTFITILAACAGFAMLGLGKSIHACITQFEFKSDIVLETALVNMYGNCFAVEVAYGVFINMKQQNVLSWNVMVGAYNAVKKAKEAFQLSRQMICTGILASKVSFVNLLSMYASQEALDEGRRLHACIEVGNYLSDAEVQNALLSLYAKCGSIELATAIFHNMSDPSVVSFNTMIAVYTDYKLEENAIELLKLMWQERLVPNVATFTSILKACAGQAALTIGKLVYACITEEGLKPDEVLLAAVVSMYGKCGSVNDAWSVFASLMNPDVVLWSAIIAAYAQYGEGWQAIQVFEQMQHCGVLPNETIFTTIFLACSHMGLINEGIYYLTTMGCRYGTKPVPMHIVCMIDLLRRAGRIEEAEILLNGVPHEAKSVPLATLLQVYRDKANMG